MKILILTIMLCSVSLSISAQKQTAPETKAKIAVADSPVNLAKSAYEAHGGKKLKELKTLTVRGSVDITTSTITQAIPATFATVFAGEKYIFELNNPFQPVKQVFDGTETLSNIRGGFTLPPLTKFGFPLLSKYDENGFKVSALTASDSRKKGFRIEMSNGEFTDFYLDEKTKQVKGYKSGFQIDGRNITTSVEIDKFRLVDGVLIPERYAQRFDLGQMTVYADFKAKEIIVNSPISDDKFVLENK